MYVRLGRIMLGLFGEITMVVLCECKGLDEAVHIIQQKELIVKRRCKSFRQLINQVISLTEHEINNVNKHCGN